MRFIFKLSPIEILDPEHLAPNSPIRDMQIGTSNDYSQFIFEPEDPKFAIETGK